MVKKISQEHYVKVENHTVNPKLSVRPQLIQWPIVALLPCYFGFFCYGGRLLAK